MMLLLTININKYVKKLKSKIFTANVQKGIKKKYTSFEVICDKPWVKRSESKTNYVVDFFV